MKISLRSKITLSALCAATALMGADQPKFETASVKRTDHCLISNSVDPETVALKGDPLKPILMEAFKLGNDQILGPSWLDEDCFEIIAKMPEGATRDQLPAMLQALLAERFGLAAHRENRPRQVLALVVDRNGPKIRESEVSTNAVGSQSRNNTMFRAGPGTSGVKGSMTMEGLARYLSRSGYGPVRDFTGLKGKYDIDLAWAPDRTFEPMGEFAKATLAAHPNEDLPPAPAPAADLFAAIRESLGLRLEQRREPVEVLVIDHIERVPTEN